MFIIDVRLPLWLLRLFPTHLILIYSDSTLSDASDPNLPVSSDPPPVRRRSRNSKPLDTYSFSNRVAMSTTLSPISILTCYKQVTAQKCWQQAMKTEFQALAENHTGDIVSLPPIIKLISSKWSPE